MCGAGGSLRSAPGGWTGWRAPEPAAGAPRCGGPPVQRRGGERERDPARGCGKTMLAERQRPDGPVGALRELGNEIRFRKGRRKVSRERNYHHNGGKNVSRGIGRGESYSAGIFLSVFVIWFEGKRVFDKQQIILISPTQPISKVSVLITPPVLPLIL